MSSERLLKILKVSLTTAISIALIELGIRWVENQRFQTGKAYWQKYYPVKTLQRAEKLVKPVKVASTGVEIHMDVYEQPQKGAPVLIFNHGAAGYCKLFVELALLYFDLGYTVVLPDQRGQGLSGGSRGDYTVQECVQNICDVATWAKEKYAAPIYMAGGSMGGALTYYAAAAGAPVEKIACLNLFNCGNGVDGLELSRFSFITNFPMLFKLMIWLMNVLQFVRFPRMRYSWFGRFNRLMDDRDTGFQKLWDADPVPPRLISLRSLSSMLNIPPAIPFAENTIPTLVINQAQDRMVDPYVTYRNYLKLGGKKQYLEISYGHWSSKMEFWKIIVAASDQWFKTCNVEIK